MATTPPHSATTHHRARNTGLGILGVVLLLVVVVGICEFIEWPFLRHPLENKLSQILERQVTFGDKFGVRLFFSLRAHTDSMVIGPAPDGGPTLVDDSGKPRDFMRADSVKLALSYRTLWDQYKGTGQPLQIHLLDVDGLELNLKRNADGHANWQFGANKPATSASSPALPTFEQLVVRNGEVRVEDDPMQVKADAHVSTREGSAIAANGAASGASAPAVRIATTASGSTIDDGGASAPASAASGATTTVADDTPGLRVDGTGTYRKDPLVLHLRTSGLMPIATNDAASPAVPLWLDVRANKSQIKVDGTATDLFHFGGMDASFVASGPSLAAVGDAIGVTLPTTAAFSTHGRVRKNGLVYSADVAAMDIGSTKLHGAFKFDTAPAVPKLSGTLQGSRLAIVDLAPAFGAATPQTPAAPTKNGKVLPEREFDIPSLKAMNADVGVDLAVLDLGTDKLEPFKPLQGKIVLQDGVLTVRDLNAKTSAGQVQGLIALDSRPTQPKWNADLRWTGIQLDRFITFRDTLVAKDANGKKPDTGYISGAMGGNAQLTGEGKSTAALLASLDGAARVWIRDGSISHILVEASGIDVAQALGVYVKGDDKFPMQCAIAQMDFNNGAITPKVGIIDTRDTTILIDGGLSLAKETLDLRMTAHPHDFSPLALRTPVKVTGTFGDPKIRPEAKPLALRAGAAAALSLITPAAALLALVDFKQADRDVCTKAVANVSGAQRAGIKGGAADGSTPGKPALQTPTATSPAPSAAPKKKAYAAPNARSKS